MCKYTQLSLPIKCERVLIRPLYLVSDYERYLL